MPLLNLKTDLKSLKYGGDRPGGGNSGQPYIQTAIPSGQIRTTPFDDGLVRGGIRGAAAASVTDAKRINKFLKDAPKGPLFKAKQIGLQFSNPKLEYKKGLLGIFDSLASLDLSSVTAGVLEPTRMYNLGINTLAQIPVNAFGVHLNRHGLLPIQDDNTKYLAVAQFNNRGDGKNNRLVSLKSKLIREPSKGAQFISRIDNYIKNAATLFNFPYKPIARTPLESVIDDYAGGPSSVYGIGRTTIRRFDNTTNSVNKYPVQDKGVINYSNALGVSKDYFTLYYNGFLDINNISNDGKTIAPPPPVVKYTTNNAVSRYLALQDKVQQQATGSIFKDRNHDASGSLASYVSSNNKIIYNNGYTKVVVNGSWSKNNRENRVGSGKQDLINLTPIFSNSSRTIGDTITINKSPYNINDLVKFRIQSLSSTDKGDITGNWMIFRAYLTELADNVNATWGEVKYAGRGEKFYVYDGFTRKISIGFKVAALSEAEMQPMYQKLNYLMGNLMPDYAGNIMRGSLVRMTIGNWIDGQEGVIDSLTYTVTNDSPWEIAINEPTNPELKQLILPHIVEVKLSFTPIGSQTKGQNLIPRKSEYVSHIAQNANEASTNQYIGGEIKPGT